MNDHRERSGCLEAENSMGFHAPQEAMRILALSIVHTRKGHKGQPAPRSALVAGQSGL